MIAELRKEFNRKFSASSYQKQVEDLERQVGASIQFRVAETPLFISQSLAKQACVAAEEIFATAASPELQQIGKTAVPSDFNVAGETDRPMFGVVDFAITGSSDQPSLKLIELQGFPSLYYFQSVFSESMQQVYDLPVTLNGLLSSSYSLEEYHQILRTAIIGEHDPNEVVLLELDPYTQKTLPDFLLTQKALGLAIVNIREVIARGNSLFYKRENTEVPIRRIYNRAIHDELSRKQVTLPFDVTQPYDVTWAGHPNWYFRISKILLPYLTGLNDTVPNAVFLNDAKSHSFDLERSVLKPLYSFAGAGVVVSPSQQQVIEIPAEQHPHWLLQEKIEYADVITTPEGAGVKAELRVMLVWPEESLAPIALHSLVRLSRGKMMGVDFNKGLDWVGSSCGLIPH